MAKRGRKPKEYALYKGDEFIALGLMTEIAEFTGINVEYLRTMTAKNDKSAYDIVCLDD